MQESIVAARRRPPSSIEDSLSTAEAKRAPRVVVTLLVNAPPYRSESFTKAEETVLTLPEADLIIVVRAGAAPSGAKSRWRTMVAEIVYVLRGVPSLFYLTRAHLTLLG